MKVTERLLSADYKYDGSKALPGLTDAQKAARDSFLEEVHKDDSYIVLKECPFCGCGSSARISEVDSKGLPCDIVICDNCQGCFKMKVLTPEAAAVHYGKISYLLRGKDRSGSAIEKLFLERVESFAYPRYYFIRHFAKLDRGRDTVAEFGCGDGANLYPWKQNGFNVFGIEYDPGMADFGQNKKLEVAAGDFMTYDLDGRCPKLVILSHLLEHVSDLDAVLKRIHSAIDANGYLFIEVPGIRVQGIGKPLAAFDVEHNYYFDLKTLSAALEKNSFEIDYGDEFIRIICRPVAGPVRIKRKALKGIKLMDLMGKAEAGSPWLKLLNKWNNAYYRFCYSILAGGGHEKR